MSDITFKKLELTDLPRLNHFLKQRKQQSANKGDLNYWLTDQQQILACARLQPIDNKNSYWLRGVYVDEHYRKQALGSQLMRGIHQTLTNEDTVFAFPYAHLHSFYGQLGYIDLAAEQLPDSLTVRYKQAQQQNKNWLCMVYATEENLQNPKIVPDIELHR